jgi:hypothetical protein
MSPGSDWYVTTYVPSGACVMSGEARPWVPGWSGHTESVDHARRSRLVALPMRQWTGSDVSELKRKCQAPSTSRTPTSFAAESG